MKPTALNIALFAVGLTALLSVGEVLLLDQEPVRVVPESEEQLFAHVDPETSLVDTVIVIKQSVLDARGGWEVNGVFTPKEEWKQTSTEGTIRKNQASKGYIYDKTREAFIPPKSTTVETVFNEEKANWELVKPACIPDATTTCP
jgi:hypothetical protein